MAEKYYENEEWRRASTLFEQIQPQYRGKPQEKELPFFMQTVYLIGKTMY